MGLGVEKNRWYSSKPARTRSRKMVRLSTCHIILDTVGPAD